MSSLWRFEVQYEEARIHPGKSLVTESLSIRCCNTNSIPLRKKKQVIEILEMEMGTSYVTRTPSMVFVRITV